MYKSTSTSNQNLLEAIYTVPENYVTEPSWFRSTAIIMAIISMGIGYNLCGHIGTVSAMITVIVGLIKIWKYIMAYELTQKLTEYGKRYENIYITSQYNTDTNVIWKAEREQEVLKVSGNKLGVLVHIISFQEGQFVCETWEQYQTRTQTFIDTDRAERHAEILQKYPQFYRTQVQGMKPYQSPIQTA